MVDMPVIEPNLIRSLVQHTNY